MADCISNIYKQGPHRLWRWDKADGIKSVHETSKTASPSTVPYEMILCAVICLEIITSRYSHHAIQIRLQYTVHAFTNKSQI